MDNPEHAFHETAIKPECLQSETVIQTATGSFLPKAIII